MAELITMPKLGFDMAEGTLVEWVKKEGDEVAEGEVIAVIETDKANVEVQSFKSGVLKALLVSEGTVVPVGDPIAVIGSPDEEIDLEALGVTAGPREEAPTEEAAAPAAKTAEPAEPTPAAPSPPTTGRILASPVARRMAEEHGIDLRQVQGSGPGGRIVKRDIEAYLKERAAVAERAPAAPPPPPPPTAYAPPTEAYEAVPLTGMRQTIARRMVESKQQAPHFYVTMEVDMAAAMSLRQQLNSLVSEEEKVSVNDLVIKAAALALREFPRLNASFAGEEIHIHEQINIGIAVALEDGLVTAVIHECDKKSLGQIAREARELITRAREGRMRLEDMTGSTFTISNLGMFGVEDFCAIINPPQAAILAVGAVRRVPVVGENDELTVGTRMKVTISADHRVTDGAEAARFLQAFKTALEQPMRLVL